jgi:hypothetical protein
MEVRRPHINEQVLSIVRDIRRVSAPRCECQTKHAIKHTILGVKPRCITHIYLLISRIHELHH